MTGGVSYPDTLFRNAGARFEDVTPDNVKALQADHGAAWVDLDRDGDVDLSLTGSRPDGMHLVLRNLLPAAEARRSLAVRVVDTDGRATLAGAEVRLFAAGTTRLLGTRLVDSGSGYNAQNDMPVHFGLAELAPVDVEITVARGGQRRLTRVADVDPRDHAGRALVVRAAGAGGPVAEVRGRRAENGR